MKVAIVPHDIVRENAEATCAAREQPVATATAAEPVALAEMFATGSPMASERIAEPPGGSIEQWMRSRSSRVEDGDGLRYAGDSAVIDPTGTVVVAAVANEMVLCGDIDTVLVRSTREHFGFLADRRTGGLRRTTGADPKPAEPDDRG